MKLPFHSVQVCGDVLFAARGGNLHSFKLTDGSHISSWRYPLERKDGKTGVLKPEDRLVISVSEESTPNPSQDGLDGPPAKRVKLDAATSVAGENGNQAGVSSAVKDQPRDDTKDKQNQSKGLPNGKRGKVANPRPGPRSQPSERPMVIILTATADRKHLVAVTQCKSIWVFEHDGLGNLKQLSRRTMPKRPCSLVITPDNQTILSADKFGDVYSVPLIPSQDSPAADPQPKEDSPAAASPSPAPQDDKPFKSQANELTVHTKRNRQALLDQQVSAKSSKRGGAQKVEVPAFERTLLLGHVSLLTAVALGHDARRRPYIITADRDEHIRVSRGTAEQAHVTEAFCMGHGEFVNRLCVPDGADGLGHLLVSGGGDPDLFVWSWLDGKLVARAPLLSAVRSVLPGAGKVAVTGLSHWRGRPAEGAEQGATILVVCERVPAIFLFTLRETGTLDYMRTINLPGNPLEVEVVDGDRLVLAVEPTRTEGGEYDLSKSLLKVENVGGQYQVTDGLIGHVPDLGEHETDLAEDELQTLLFNAENLRKTDFEEGLAEAE